MAIFRGVGGSGDSSDNSFLDAVTTQANAAEASATSAANSLATIQNTEVTSAAFNTGDGVLTLTKLGGATVTADLDGRFLTSYTETNNLTTAVTWADVPDANITQSSVTQHQGALSITESQISDLQTYLTASDISGKANLAGANFTGNVTVDNNLLYVDTTANAVGVGTASPQDKLHVNGTLRATDLYVTGGESYLCRTHAVTDTSLSVLRLCSISTGDMADGFGTGITFDAQDNSGVTQSQVAEINAVRAGADNVFNLELQTGDVARLTLGTDGAVFATGLTGTDRFKIDPSGNVGINTGASSISEKLDVVGNIAVSGTVDGVDIAGLNTTVAGKANLTGATFSGNVSIGTPPSGTQSLLVAGVSNLYGGASVTGNITVTGTVDGRDVSVDGARLDTIPYHRVKHTQLRANNTALNLSTAYNNVGLYDTIQHPATPVECARYLDLDIAIKWFYVNTNTNDLYLQLHMTVPAGGGTIYNMGTATRESVNNPEYNTYGNFAWYYVSGDYTHLFTEFGRINTGTGTSEGLFVAWEYDSVNNRTYMMSYSNPGVSFNTGDTFYYSPYAFESAGTALIVTKEIDERYVSSGVQPHSFKFKTSYDDAALSYKLQMKEYTSGDSGQVLETKVTLTDVEEL